MQLQPDQQPDSSPNSGATPPRSFGFVAFLAGCVAMAGLFLISDGGKAPMPNGASVATSSSSVPGAGEIDLGQQLSKVKCTLCHLYPEPTIADRYTWAMHYLPTEVRREGVGRPAAQPAANGLGMWTNATPVVQQPPLSATEWRAICAYYLAKAPEAPLPQKGQPIIAEGLKHFRILVPQYQRPAETSMVKVDAGTGTIFVGNVTESKLDVVTPGKGILGSIPLGSAPMDVMETKEGLYIALVGKYRWSDEPLGKIVFLARPQDGRQSELKDVMGGLRSPSRVIVADLNKDGRDDILVVEPGDRHGSLTWFEKLEDGSYRPHVLLDQPGTVQVQLYDLQKDGLPEIFVMTGGARQGISMFLNRGKGQFLLMPIMTEQPAWGWTGFELVDFNGDGHPDILATNGENLTASQSEYSLRNYHGIHIYMNDGQNRFTESFFFPMNGATKALARDFDQDGDLDIAAISFFPDYLRPRPLESFVYLENLGGMKFSASSMRESLAGRWNTMDAADGDGDGDIDIVLGASNRGPGEVPAALQKAWSERSIPLLILENQTAQAGQGKAAQKK